MKKKRKERTERTERRRGVLGGGSALFLLMLTV